MAELILVNIVVRPTAVVAPVAASGLLMIMSLSLHTTSTPCPISHQKTGITVNARLSAKFTPRVNCCDCGEGVSVVAVWAPTDLVI